MSTVVVRNAHLIKVQTGIDLTSDFTSDLMDFKEMNVGAIQGIISTGGTADTGTFQLEVSLHCDPDTFIVVPSSDRQECAGKQAFGWEICCVAWRYWRVCYTADGTPSGTVDLWATGRRT